MKRLILLCLLALSCKKTDPTGVVDAGAGPSVERAIVPSGGCQTSLTDEQSQCAGVLGAKLDKYTWKVTKAGSWDVALTQPREIGGFRPVIIIWQDPDKTIEQNDGILVGGPAKVTAKLEPGTYRISIINGSKTQEPPPSEGYPYSIAITRAP